MTHPIPGTPVFTGAYAQKGYALNKMRFSFNKAENRAAFKADHASRPPVISPVFNGAFW
jgi:protocatechuate 4,5-dioxygenase, alpha chain